MLLCTSGTVISADENVVQLAVGDWPPYSSEDLPGLGLFNQIVTESFRIKGYRVEYGFFPWKRSLEIAKTEEWDGSAPWQPTEERKRAFFFSLPVLSNTIVFFHRADTDFDWQTLRDIQGLRVGTTRGYAYSPAFRKASKELGIKLIDSDSDLLNLKLLLARRIHLHPSDKLVGLYLIQTYFNLKERKLFSYHKKVINRSPLSVIFPKNIPGSHSLMAQFNQGFLKLKKTGRLQEILDGFGKKCLSVNSKP